MMIPTPKYPNNPEAQKEYDKLVESERRHCHGEMPGSPLPDPFLDNKSIIKAANIIGSSIKRASEKIAEAIYETCGYT